MIPSLLPLLLATLALPLPPPLFELPPFSRFQGTRLHSPPKLRAPDFLPRAAGWRHTTPKRLGGGRKLRLGRRYNRAVDLSLAVSPASVFVQREIWPVGGVVTTEEAAVTSIALPCLVDTSQHHPEANNHSSWPIHRLRAPPRLP